MSPAAFVLCMAGAGGYESGLWGTRESMNKLPSEQAKARYWRKNLGWLGGLLTVWFIASYGCGVLWADFLDQYRIPGTGFKLGFWFAQQGSIYVFILLIAIYVVVMNRLERQLMESADDSGLPESRNKSASIQTTPR